MCLGCGGFLMHSAWKASLKEIEGISSVFFFLIFLLIFKEFFCFSLFKEI